MLLVSRFRGSTSQKCNPLSLCLFLVIVGIVGSAGNGHTQDLEKKQLKNEKTELKIEPKSEQKKSDQDTVPQQVPQTKLTEKLPHWISKEKELSAILNSTIVEQAKQSEEYPKFPYDPVDPLAVPERIKFPEPKVKVEPKINNRSVKLSPENQVRIANNLLSQLSRRGVVGVQNLRFLSFFTFEQNETIAMVALANGWINQMHRTQRIKYIVEVPDSDGYLWMFDYTWFDWTAEAIVDVFSREPFFRTPPVKPETAEAMRTLLGLVNVKLEPNAKPEQYRHCLGIVRGDWFIYDTGETLRSTSYYDLLFSRERYVPAIAGSTKDQKQKSATELAAEQPKVIEPTRTITYPHPGGKYKDKDYPPGSFLIEMKVDVLVDIKKTDFPATEDEWNKAFGIDKQNDFQKEQILNLDNGAVVDGFEANGSMVARQNRLLLRKRGGISYHWKTHDTDRTTGDSNYFQTLQFKFDFIAGEFIAGLPAGGQAYGLYTKAGKRAEDVPNSLAIDRTDKYDVRVRNPGSCVVCHANGIISPDCIVNKFFREGGSFRSRLNKQQQQEVEDFFFQLEEKVKLDQEQFAKFIRKATGTEPEFNGRNYAAARNRYNQPITLQKAAIEFGIGELELMIIASRSIKSRTVALTLNRGFPVPRRTWDEEVYPELALLMVVFESKAADTKAKTLEELVDEVIDQLKNAREPESVLPETEGKVIPKTEGVPPVVNNP